jgi:hypothetical protein
MTRRDRKKLAPDSVLPAKVKTAKARDAERLPAAPPAEEPPVESSHDLAPFMTEEHERFGNADMQTAAGPSAGIEQVGASPPEQIDPGAGGKVVI